MFIPKRCDLFFGMEEIKIVAENWYGQMLRCMRKTMRQLLACLNFNVDRFWMSTKFTKTYIRHSRTFLIYFIHNKTFNYKKIMWYEIYKLSGRYYMRYYMLLYLIVWYECDSISKKYWKWIGWWKRFTSGVASIAAITLHFIAVLILLLLGHIIQEWFFWCFLFDEVSRSM